MLQNGSEYHKWHIPHRMNTRVISDNLSLPELSSEGDKFPYLDLSSSGTAKNDTWPVNYIWKIQLLIQLKFGIFDHSTDEFQPWPALPKAFDSNGK